MRVAVLAALGVLAAGVALVVDSAARGEATVSLVLIFPVLSGDSPEFVAGVGLVVAGLFATPLAWAYSEVDDESPDRRRPAAGPGEGFGGVVLVGPVPIVFGGWRGLSRRARWGLAPVGLGLTGAVVLVWWLVR